MIVDGLVGELLGRNLLPTVFCSDLARGVSSVAMERLLRKENPDGIGNRAWDLCIKRAVVRLHVGYYNVYSKKQPKTITGYW
jgi:hypothetical protein